jgi:hypothetical protein
MMDHLFISTIMANDLVECPAFMRS